MPANRTTVPARAALEDKARADVANRLKSARGHLDHVIRIVEADGYPIEVMRQISAVRGALDSTVRAALRYHLQRAFTDAVKRGTERAATDDLMDALKFMSDDEP